MVGLYRVVRAGLTLAPLAVAATLVVSLAIDFAGHRGVLEDFANRMDDSWSPIAAMEAIPGFWSGLVFVIGLVGGMWLAAGVGAFSRWRSLRARQRPLEILFDPDDHRFVHREFRNGQLTPTTCVKFAIHNGTGDTTLQDVVVSTGRNRFARALIEPAWGGRTRRIERIEPNATEFIDLFALADGAIVPPDVLGHVYQLVVRARAKDARGAAARFEFDARANPVLRRVC